MTGVRKRFCTGDRNRKAGKSEWCDQMFGEECLLAYLMQRLEIIMNKIRCSECMSNGIFTEKDWKNGMTLTGCS